MLTATPTGRGSLGGNRTHICTLRGYYAGRYTTRPYPVLARHRLLRHSLAARVQKLVIVAGVEPCVCRLKACYADRCITRSLCGALCDDSLHTTQCISAIPYPIARLSYPKRLLPRIVLMVRVEGFEPSAPWSQAKCSSRLSYTRMVLPDGFGPPTNAL